MKIMGPDRAMTLAVELMTDIELELTSRLRREVGSADEVMAQSVALRALVLLDDALASDIESECWTRARRLVDALVRARSGAASGHAAA